MRNPTIGFRPTDKIQEYIDFQLKKHPKKSKSEIIIELCEGALSYSGQGEELPSKKEWLKSIQHDPPYEEITSPKDEKDFQKCIYFTSTKEKGKTVVKCQKDFAKKGKIYTMTEEECATCWKRRNYIRSKKSVNSSQPLDCARGIRIFPTNMGIPCYQICRFKYPTIFRECTARKEIEQIRKTRAIP